MSGHGIPWPGEHCLCEACWKALPRGERAPVGGFAKCAHARPGEPQPCCRCGAPTPWLAPKRSAVDDARERRDRAVTIVTILERCRQELERLEQIPSDDADDTNAVSAAKGYVARAQLALGGRFAS